MKQRNNHFSIKRKLSMVLALALCISGIPVSSGMQTTAKAADTTISIASADDLKKIGNDSAYPMDGDYVLTSDIDLSGENWTPIGGSSGPEYGLTSGDRVFSGTFDGAGHVIMNLTINYDGSSSSQKTNQSGLFAMIGSDSASDYAEVKNINFTDVSITHSLGGGDSIGTLAADVDGYVKVNNIAVLGGSISVNGNNGGDLVGAGGVVGQVRRNISAVQMSNLYNAATVTVASNVSTSPVRCGGILGRIHQSEEIGSLTSCLNVGTVTYKGNSGYAINGYSSSTNASSNTANISNCYYLEGTGMDGGASTSLTEAQLASEEIAAALGSEYWTIYNGNVMPLISQGKIITPIPSPTFADGDKASSVTSNFTLPLTYTSEEGTEETITWTSSNTDVVKINGATAEVQGVLADTQVTLTAVTSGSNRTKTVTITVVSNLSLTIDQEYAKPGTAMTASVENAPDGTSFTYAWKVDNTQVSTTASYTPQQSDLNHFITVTASLNGSKVDELEIYCSKLPVVYIDTLDGYGITSKTVYKDANIHIQGNDEFNSTTTTLYDGLTEIRGRGNSTWNTSYSKLPYKLKLDSKTDLMGFGVSKHWTLLANYMDESLLRNYISYNLSGDMGMVYLKSTHVELILNGVYAGNYQLVGNVRIEDTRADIFDWEDCAEDVAKAIAKKEGIKGDAKSALEDYLNEHMEWITSGQVTYNGVTYDLSNYVTDEIPTDEEGNVDISGGYLFELDEYYDEVSKFKTNYNQPMMFKSPEFVNTNSDMMEAAQNFIQAFEDSVHAEDFYVEYDGKTQHYTDLVDMDSLVRYFVLNEFFWNTETMKKSTYMYKDIGEKMYIGPVWDMDWTSNSIVSQAETSNYRVWMTNDRSANAQAYQWYKYLIGDPYFITQVYECYAENRQNFEDIIKDGGIIDQQEEYLAESAEANYNAGYLKSHVIFESQTERLKTFLTNRLNWMDAQFTSVENLVSSFGKYSSSKKISVAADTTNTSTTTYTATLSGSSASKVGFYINGILAGTATVTNGTAVYEASDSYLTREKEAYNTIQVRSMSANGSLISGESNYAVFTKEIPTDALDGKVTISGTAKTGSVLTAVVSESNNTGTLSYQWMADGTAIDGATKETYKVTANEIGKAITVVVTSSIETGSLVSAATSAVVQDEVKNDHVIINQVYGGGNNDETPVSHSFIELYNPTDAAISLDGYSIGYLSGGGNGPAATEVKLSLSGTLPAKTSYLVRCEPQDTSTPDLIKFSVDSYDQEWSQIIDNKRYQITLYNGTAVEDAVSVNEGAVEGEALPDGTISKQKAIRRKNFADTNNNQSDFEVISYRDNAEAPTVYYPRSLKDGAWGSNSGTGGGETEEDALTGTLSIRGNAIVGALLYADESTNNTGDITCQWYADGKEIAGETDLFFIPDKSYEGAKISVTIKSSVQTGTLSYEMTETLAVVEAQTDHVIINQVYGGGGKGGTPISHSFIELYNPTSEEVSLDGWKLIYLSKGEEASLELSGSIPAGTSFLIQCAAEDTTKAVYTITDADMTWDQIISNKRYSIVLYDTTQQVDGVAVNEDAVEGEPLVNPEGDEIISKNKSIRRIQFIDTDQNAADFEVLNYSKLPDEILTAVTPKSKADGKWGIETGSGSGETSKTHTVTFDVDGTKTTVPVNHGEKVSAIEEPKKEGYIFNGWYLDGILYKFDEAVTSDLVLTAKFIEDLDYINRNEEGKDDDPAKPGVLAAPAVTAVKSVISKKASRVLVKVNPVAGATEYQIYRTKGSVTTLVGTTTDGTFYDEKPVGGKVSYAAKAVKGSVVSETGASMSITLPKAVKKVTVKAVAGKKAVLVKWKRVKGATGYMVYRSNKKDGVYKRIKTLKKNVNSYTDKKVKTGKKYYYRIVTVKKKTYSPAKTSKMVKVK